MGHADRLRKLHNYCSLRRIRRQSRAAAGGIGPAAAGILRCRTATSTLGTPRAYERASAVPWTVPAGVGTSYTRDP
jgi:hypothetical protein